MTKLTVDQMEKQYNDLYTVISNLRDLYFENKTRELGSTIKQLDCQLCLISNELHKTYPDSYHSFSSPV